MCITEREYSENEDWITIKNYAKLIKITAFY